MSTYQKDTRRGVGVIKTLKLSTIWGSNVFYPFIVRKKLRKYPESKDSTTVCLYGMNI